MSVAAKPESARPPESLAERFWSLARGMEASGDSDEPVAVVQHVLAVLDALDSGEVGGDVTVNTLSFLALLRQQEVKGDLLYASPEQARGEQMDERSLVFSAGVLLFEKLTGRHPFGAEGNPRRLARIRRAELASGVNYFPKIPDALRTVLARAMGPFPEERWNSLAELRARLEAFLEDAAHPERQRAHPRPKSLPALPTDESERAPRDRRTSGRSVIVAMEAIERPRHVEETEEVELVVGRRRPMPRHLVPVAWMSAGALAATALFLVLRSSGPAPATAAPQPAASGEAPPAPLVQAAAPQAEQAPATPSFSGATAPAAAPAEDGAEGERDDDAAEAAADEPAVFDLERGGERAASAARDCFTEERRAAGIRFGASLIYAPSDGLSHKLYFGGADELTPAERSCLSKKLVGLDAGAPPPRSTVAMYTFAIDARDSRIVKSRIQE